MFSREAVPVVDQCGHVIVVMAGQLDDPNWQSVHKEAAKRLESLRLLCRFSDGQCKHRRGIFGALSVGISYGGGQTYPQNLHHGKTNTAVLMQLINLTVFICLASFGSLVFATWLPLIFQYYAIHLRDLLLHDASLIVNWTRSIFSAATNLPFGWCAITALGHFNPLRGGHLILWDLKLIIDFPPGSTILIPSVILRHSNMKIGRRERCYSFTQYTAGGLFRWVDYSFRTSEDYWAALSAEECVQAEDECRKCWSFGLSLFTTLDTLHTS
ncbi:hypothetical protein IW262DRAFT_1450768 [Armillaria fumosa]|nr:hypothetical protein IW262DRAFT_1450768 [Armillaria fumosa]